MRKAVLRRVFWGYDQILMTERSNSSCNSKYEPNINCVINAFSLVSESIFSVSDKSRDAHSCTKYEFISWLYAVFVKCFAHRFSRPFKVLTLFSGLLTTALLVSSFFCYLNVRFIRTNFVFASNRNRFLLNAIYFRRSFLFFAP